MDEDKVAQILANPFYCGFTVHPALTAERVIEPGYANVAARIADEVGSGAFLRNFLDRLQNPELPLPPGSTIREDGFLTGFLVHPDFAIEHPPVVDIATFVAAGIATIEQAGFQDYFLRVLDNLRGNWV